MPGSRNTQKASSQRCSGDSNNGKVIIIQPTRNRHKVYGIRPVTIYDCGKVQCVVGDIGAHFCRHKLLQCIRCQLAWHLKCAASPEDVTLISNQPGKAICWRLHPTEELSRVGNSTNEIEFFRYSPVPVQQFGVDNTWKNSMENGMEPPPYIPITRNMYLVEKKRSEWDDDSGCEKCSSICSEDCLCRYQNMSCSKACRCSNTCTNRPFQKHKRIEVVKTKSCGWGAEAAEPINKGEFIVEYVGEVLSDDIYEERLRDMDCLGRQHFYMCKVDRDFTIDSTYKGNISRFLNHSCDPNCTLEKWQVNGETRMGIFAAKSIEEGEPLTYDYRFVQSGADVKCECGSSNCQGFLGVKKKARGGRKAR
ncbi:hypothetical protein DCAR_0520532 [Daucus carota subsp. sativus]|uniref:Histone-lysine N-methyltransferase n=2 Tax=Daucus carota subsp. sativus TaxID=79200 RepID=A0AAF0X3J7_DAUCS|nr:hypothetical protein DCAR_0520532 [Daucus carota subsp. sativus]